MKAYTTFLSSLLFSSQVTAKAWSVAAAPGSCNVTYSVQPGDTCWSIMRSNDVTFAQIISWNSNLDKSCSNLGELEGQDICMSNPDGDYAIPSNSHGIPTIITTTAPVPGPTPDDTEDRCAEYHLVQPGEDCSNFMIKYEISLKDFLFLNPHVWENCTNVYLDYYYCVRPVGYISTYPGYLPPTTTKEFVKTPTTKLPMVQNPLENYPRPQPPIPIADQTRRDCLEYFSLMNQTETPSLVDCWALAMVFGITREEFVLWNPSLAQGENNGSSTHQYNYPCAISESSSYCVALESETPAPTPDTIAPPSPRAAGEIENCTVWYAPESYETCEGVLITNSLTFDEFFAMNPSIKSDCTGLTLGTFYCVTNDPNGGRPTSLPVPTATSTTTSSSSSTSTGTGIATPTPTQEGMVRTCDDFYLVEAGDLCDDIAEEHGISRADFNAWNPDVRSDCTGLIAEYYVCVGVYADPSPSPSSPPPTTTTGGGPGSTPTPTQSGMVSGCTDFYMVKDGDGCWAIADSEGIDLNDLYEWNPAIGNDCSGLLFGFYICTGRE